MRTLPLAVVLLASSASAQMLNDRGPPLHRIVHKNTFAVRYNPLGLLYDGRFSYRLRLYETPSVALRDNYVGIGLAPTASPAFLRVGPYVEFSPLSLFNVWAAFQFSQYFGSFDLFQSFPSAQANFSDSQIRAQGGALPAGDPLRNYVTNGWELTIGATFQAKLAFILLRSQARLVWASMRLRGGDTTYYDQFYDVLVPNGGWFFTNDLDVVYQGLDNRLIAGARYTFTAPFYDQRHLAGQPDPINAMHRVGPFFGWTFKSEDGAAFNNPTVFLLVQWWLQNRWRTGTDVSQAIPLMGIGFQMTGDFLPLAPSR